MRDGLDGVFFGADLEGVDELGRDASGLVKRGCEGIDVATAAFGCAGALGPVSGAVSGVVYEIERAGVLTSGGSEEGGSEPMLGLSGVRNGDLNGLFKVFVASFSRRRLACGVDILICAAALKVVLLQV